MITTNRTSQAPTPYTWQVGLLIAVVALSVGALLAFGGVLITIAALLATAAGLWIFSRLEVGLWSVIAVIAILPFATLPFKVVITPSFLDLALIAVFAVYALQWMKGERFRLAMTPAHFPILIFMAFSVFSFVLGMPNGPVTSNLIRQFGEMLVSIALVFIIVDYADTPDKLIGLTRILLIGGVAMAAIGIGLYLLPTDLSEQALSALRVFNYPAGGVLRFIEDNPANAQRAIGTAIDPNVLGGMLAMLGGLLAPQLLAQQTLFKWKSLAYVAFAIVVICLVLTFSRGAMGALAIALLGIATLRYRSLLWVIALIGALVLLLPITQDYVAHFVEGLQGQDLATQMRLGEYKDAFILISRYPLLGVGFAGAPDIDIYLGVSNAYLLTTMRMGVVGLLAFALVVVTVYSWAIHHRRAAYQHPSLAPIWLGAHAGLAAALGAGLVDHYFVRLDFHAAGTLFWLFIGLCLASTRLTQQVLK